MQLGASGGLVRVSWVVPKFLLPLVVLLSLCGPGSGLVTEVGDERSVLLWWRVLCPSPDPATTAQEQGGIPARLPQPRALGSCAAEGGRRLGRHSPLAAAPSAPSSLRSSSPLPAQPRFSRSQTCFPSGPSYNAAPANQSVLLQSGSSLTPLPAWPYSDQSETEL